MPESAIKGAVQDVPMKSVHAEQGVNGSAGQNVLMKSVHIVRCVIENGARDALKNNVNALESMLENGMRGALKNNVSVTESVTENGMRRIQKRVGPTVLPIAQESVVAVAGSRLKNGKRYAANTAIGVFVAGKRSR